MKINSDHCKNNDSKKRPDCPINNITQKNIDIKGYYTKVDNSLKTRNIKWSLINDHMSPPAVSLPTGRSYLNLFVKDTKGNLETGYYAIRKIHKEKVLKSYQQMLLAILPFDAIGTDKCSYQYDYRYFYNTLLKYFKDTGRFNLVEENRLEHLFLGDLVQTACKTSTMCDENIAQLNSADTPPQRGSIKTSSTKR